MVADAGMISEANQIEITAAGLTYILGARLPYLPDVVRDRRSSNILRTTTIGSIAHSNIGNATPR
jgi:hypothetical protein